MRASGVAPLLVKLLSVTQKPEPAGWLDVAPTENPEYCVLDCACRLGTKCIYPRKVLIYRGRVYTHSRI